MKSHIYTAIVSVVVTLFCVFVYQFYHLITLVGQHEYVFQTYIYPSLEASKQAPAPVATPVIPEK